MKNKIFKRLFAVLLAMLFICSKTVTAFADTTETEVDVLDPYIMVDGYKISDDRIVAGESFTLTLYLKNYSTVRTAREVIIDIENPSGVAPIYGTVSQIFLGDIKPQETREVSFEYDTYEEGMGEFLQFSVAIVSDTRANYVKLRVPASLDTVFGVVNTSMVTENYAGLSTSASMSFRVLGEESVGNIELRVEYNGETIGRSQVGSVTAGMTKTQSVSFVLKQPGEYALDFYLDYVSEAGKSETEYLGSKVLTIKAIPTDDTSGNVDQTVEQPTGNDNVTVLLLGGLVILAIFAVAVVIIKKKR